MEYNRVKGTKLKLKGDKNTQVIKKKKRKAPTDSISTEALKQQKEELEDTAKHGGWWCATKFDEIGGTVAIEFGEQSYVKCLDDGTFTLGAPHDQNEGPFPEEIFTAIRINEDKIALKSGYGKYLGVDKDGNVIGRSDAVGAPEQWEVVFEEGKMALLGHMGCFMSIDPVEEAVIAKSKKAGPTEIIQLRTQNERNLTKDDGPVEEKGSISQIEVNFVKKFQKFQDKKMRINTDDIETVRKAQEEGDLHETLLDRRAKMKADRYCK